MTDTDGRYLIEREWREPGQLIRLNVDREHRASVYFEGKGSMPGAHAFVALLEEMRLELGPAVILEAIVDMRALSKSPLRAQFLIGKWLFANKRQLKKIAVFGGKPLEMRIARAVMKIARMKNANFFDTLDQSIRWLGWPEGVYP